MSSRRLWIQTCVLALTCFGFTSPSLARSTPLPPVVLRWPEPVAHEPPDCTVTLTAPVGATRPDTEAGLSPALVTIPLEIATG